MYTVYSLVFTIKKIFLYESAADFAHELYQSHYCERSVTTVPKTSSRSAREVTSACIHGNRR